MIDRRILRRFASLAACRSDCTCVPFFSGGIFEACVKAIRETPIIIDPAVMMGKLVVKGTRFTVELISETLAAGETSEHILSEHPHLSEQQIRAALDAVRVLESDIANEPVVD